MKIMLGLSARETAEFRILWEGESFVSLSQRSGPRWRWGPGGWGLPVANPGSPPSRIEDTGRGTRGRKVEEKSRCLGFTEEESHLFEFHATRDNQSVKRDLR